MIEIMNLRKEKPSEKWDFIVDRTTPLGNPYFLSVEKDRDKVCDAYTTWFRNLIRNRVNLEALNLLAVLVLCYKLQGKLRLFCWCAPKRCHAETIKEYILREKIKYEDRKLAYQQDENAQRAEGEDGESQRSI